ncbi:MAG TPA: histidine--tRNA ligase [Chloroflexota bacterium]
MTEFATPRGTVDILPEDWPYWDFVIETARRIAELYGYRRIETPTLGEVSLYVRATGEATDIVQKEMYAFRDQGGDDLTLRPEGTAPVVRAYFQHGMNRLPQPVKLFYIERMYRREAPQRGRLREHHQFGCEAIGSPDPGVDVEMLALLVQFYRELGLSGLELHLNSMGDGACRPAYLQALTGYLRTHQDELSGLDQGRLSRNPLRVLDTKEAKSRDVVSGAPSILDYLCEPCREHWNAVRAGLDALDIGYQIDPALVRGLDYYTRTVFEFQAPHDGAQSAVGGGGRYDGLAETIGAPPTPGIGFGSGIERLILTIKEQGLEPPLATRPRVYVAHLGADAATVASRVSTALRAAGIVTLVSFGSRSMKAQMKAANTAGAAYALIIGEDEVGAGAVTMRDLETGAQTAIPESEIVSAITP